MTKWVEQTRYVRRDVPVVFYEQDSARPLPGVCERENPDQLLPAPSGSVRVLP